MTRDEYHRLPAFVSPARAGRLIGISAADVRARMESGEYPVYQSPLPPRRQKQNGRMRKFKRRLAKVSRVIVGWAYGYETRPAINLTLNGEAKH